MTRSNGTRAAILAEEFLGRASWLLSHAQALADQGRLEEAEAKWNQAASTEEQVACLLDLDGQHLEAAIHRVSAASCFARQGQAVRAVTLLQAALATKLRDEYRAEVESLLKRSMAQAKKELRKVSKNDARQPSPAIS